MINIRHKATMQKCLWKDVRTEVTQKNPELAKIIDDLNPGAKYPLFEVTYPFGTEILKNGILQLPTAKGDTAPITDPQFEHALQEQLGYNLSSNPVSFILNGSTEIFLELEDRIIPLYGLISPGKLFGLWRIIYPQISHTSAFLWGMTAGARSMGMLAKLSHGKSHKRLINAFHISQDVPKDFWEHWSVFRQLYQSENFGESWELKLLFFPKEWFGEQFRSDPAWAQFRGYAIDTVSQSSDFRRNQFIYDLIFSLIQERGRLKINPFATNVAKNAVYMGMGEAPGFAPAIDDSAGPIIRLQAIYSEDYQLTYAPTIMSPHMFSINEQRPVYYSLAVTVHGDPVGWISAAFCA